MTRKRRRGNGAAPLPPAPRPAGVGRAGRASTRTHPRRCRATTARGAGRCGLRTGTACACGPYRPLIVQWGNRSTRCVLEVGHGLTTLRRGGRNRSEPAIMRAQSQRNWCENYPAPFFGGLVLVYPAGVSSSAGRRNGQSCPAPLPSTPPNGAQVHFRVQPGHAPGPPHVAR